MGSPDARKCDLSNDKPKEHEEGLPEKAPVIQKEGEKNYRKKGYPEQDMFDLVKYKVLPLFFYKGRPFRRSNRCP